MSQNSERVPICVVGCGGMGHRHTIAYHTLEETGMSNVELMAVCDINRDNAERIAGEVERLFDRKPLIFTRPGPHAGPPRYRRRRRGYRRLQPPRNRNSRAGGRQTRPGGETAGHHHPGLPAHHRRSRTERHGARDRGKLPPRSGQPHGARRDRRRNPGRSATDDADIARRQRCHGRYAPGGI